MKKLACFLAILLLFLTVSSAQTPFGFRNASAQAELEKRFLSYPDAKLAGEHLRFLTSAPHIAGSPEDRATAEYVARKYREAGLDTQIVEYRVWLNYPAEVSVDVIAPATVKMHAPNPERVVGDPFQNDSRIVTAFNGYSPSGDAEADVIYANYGRPEDLQKLKEMGIDVRGKILLVRYGQNFRGVKSFVAEEASAAAVLIYSDPADDGWVKGDKYPAGPWRPDSGVQRGSIGYMFHFPGDPTTPGIASLPSLPDIKRIRPEVSAEIPKILTTPLSHADAWPILENLGGPDSPREWQGALPFTYHVGPGPVRVKIHLRQDYGFHSVWNVIGTVRGSDYPEQWVIAGNHRDAWVYGAVDPSSGTAAQLEAVHATGELLKSGWKPKRTMIFASWDAEEYGLIGSTEWGEEHEKELARAVAYFNMDVGVAGPNFSASAVPSLKRFIADLAKDVPSPKGGSLFDAWKSSARKPEPMRQVTLQVAGPQHRPPDSQDIHIGELGSGSDYTVFLQHLGVPATDISSTGPYGVYHSVFDNYAWFKKFADPTFVYEQQMARFFGLEALRMATADVLPFDYQAYGKDITGYIDAAQKKAKDRFGDKAPDFTSVRNASRHLTEAGAAILKVQQDPKSDPNRLNNLLIDAERAFLTDGLPNRPWFRHAIYAPGEYTGYAAVVLPGVNEAIDQGDIAIVQQQIAALAAAIDKAARTLEAHH